MTLKKLSIALLVAVLGLTTGACSKEAATETAAMNDTAVHTAEVSAAGKDELFAKGEAVFLANCAACHQPTGKGLPGAFPPLAESDFLKGDRKAVMAVALFGRTGPLTVNGVEYNGVMPSMGHLPDEDLAAALSYIFGAWGNDGSAVSVAEVSALRVELGQTDRAAGERHQGCDGRRDEVSGRSVRNIRRRHPSDHVC